MASEQPAYVIIDKVQASYPETSSAYQLWEYMKEVSIGGSEQILKNKQVHTKHEPDE